MLLSASALAVPSASSARALLTGPIELELEPGWALGIVGPSGCGKSTLLRALAMLEPLAQGQVRFRGAAVEDHGVAAFRRRVQYVAQHPARTAGSVEDSLRLAYTFHSAAGGCFDRARALALCETLGLPHQVLEQELSALSGGEAQRIALIRALLLDPSVLLLDEPSSGLDEASREKLEAQLRLYLDADAERALILVTHDRAQVTRLATHLRVFDDTRTLGALQRLA